MTQFSLARGAAAIALSALLLSGCATAAPESLGEAPAGQPADVEQTAAPAPFDVPAGSAICDAIQAAGANAVVGTEFTDLQPDDNADGSACGAFDDTGITGIRVTVLRDGGVAFADALKATTPAEERLTDLGDGYRVTDNTIWAASGEGQVMLFATAAPGSPIDPVVMKDRFVATMSALGIAL
jgi:hypothetical protein